ncbi:uncharacterized protein [Clytia hemisphaerica]|uniref:Uncharacterized protein n=1 Tax=Clytia hemisphaerica TaxID=252671 RepID=A0A7M5XBG3_9CNID
MASSFIGMFFAGLVLLSSVQFILGDSAYITIIDVGKQPNDGCKKDNQGHYQCGSLKNLASFPFTDNTCIRIWKDLTSSILGSVISISKVSNISISSYPPSKTFRVPCFGNENQKSGFNFQNVKSVRISNIKFEECGHPMPSFVTHPDFKKPINIWSAIYFKEVTDISMTGVSFNGSHGYATALFNVQGEIKFDNIIIEHNELVQLKTPSTQKVIPGYASGGGIYIELRKQEINTPSISLQHSHFLYNTADNVSASPTGSGMAEGHIGFGRGGALSLFFLNVNHVTVDILNCWFEGNKAAWGGAVYARFRNESSYNTINMVNTNFTNNNANLSGGGLFVTSTQREDFENKVEIHQCRFINNSAEIGGAMFQKHISLDSIKDLRTITIAGTQFTHNMANIGSAINLERIFVIFNNMDTMNNFGSTFNGTGGQGAIYAFESKLYCYGSNLFKENMNNAFVLDCSHLHFPGTALFDRNKGENGGAISMYGNSFLFLYNSTELTFKNNTAWRRGGAIYIESSGPPLDHNLVNALKFDRCFFQYAGETVTTFEDNIQSFEGKVSFTDNYAKINGDSIFISSLAACNVTSIGINDTLLHWKNFNFRPKNRTQIITRAVEIHINDLQWHQPPGTMFHPSIILLDQRGNHVSEQINVIIHKNHSHKQCNVSVETNPRFIVTEDDTISLTLLGNNQPKIDGKYGKYCYYDVTISLAWNKVVYKTLTDRQLKPCYFGYTLKKNRCQCLMQKNQDKGIAFCYRGDIYFYKNRWAYRDQKAFIRDAEITVTCPPGYCNDCKGGVSITGYDCRYDQTKPNQCRPSRDQNSKICGRCLHGWSVALGKEECVKCKNEVFSRYSKWNWIWVIIATIVFFVMVDAVIIWLDIDIYSNYLNGFIYYCQTIVLLPPSSFEYWYPMKLITGIINMDSTGGFIPAFCFIDGFDNLWKALFNYLFPTIMILILVVIGYLARDPNSRFANVNYMKSFTIISVLAYSDFTRITFQLLNRAKLDPDEPNKLNVWIQGDVEYLKGYHIGFAVVAIIVGFFIVLGFPIVLFFHYKLVALRPLWGQNPFRRLTTFFKYFNYCYRDDQLYFISFYYTSRVVLLGLNTFVPIDAESSTWKCLLCLLVCVVFTFNEPYDKPLMNYYDIFILSNLTVVSMLCLMMRGFAPNRHKVFRNLINVLILLPFILVTIRIFWVYGPKFWNWIKEKFSNDSKPTNPDLSKPLLSKTDDGDQGEQQLPDDSIEC